MIRFILALSFLVSCLAEARGRDHDQGRDEGPAEIPTVEETWQDVNGGLPQVLKSFSAKLNPDFDYVTLIAKAPKHVMDLRSAENFRRSILSIPITDAAENIGHMMVAWQCHDQGGAPLRGGASVTGEQENQTVNMVKAGWGQTSFFATFSDGSVDGSWATDEVLEEAVKNKMQVAHITVRVPRASCQKMVSFLKSYVYHPQQPIYHFGNNLEPLNFEGGGCGSFATAMLSKADIFSEVRPLMWRELRATVSLLGGGDQEIPAVVLPKSLRAIRKKVDVGVLQQTPWTGNDGPALKVLDPEMMLLTLRTIARSAGLPTPGALEERRVTSQWSEIVDGHFENRVEFYPINQVFDRRARAVMEGAQSQLKSWKAQGLKVRSTKLGISDGLLID